MKKLIYSQEDLNLILSVEMQEKDEEIDRLNKELGIFQRENDKLKHKLNDIAFGDDSELALRFLRRIDYVDFDEKRKVYINKHNNEPFLWKDEREKDYYLKDEELNEYIQQLEYKVEQLENIRKEIKKEIKKYAYTDTFGDTVVLAKYIEDILNKGE